MNCNIAVILAGGVGNRMNSELPKQLLKIAGKTVIEHTLSVFEKHDLIDEIFIVSNTNYIENIENILCTGSFKKVSKVLTGGKERYDSSISAIRACSSKGAKLIFHDAVRPLLNPEIITDVIQSLDTHNAVDVAIPCTDTIIQVDVNNFINDIPKRSFLKKGQTPQGFRYETIKEAYRIGLEDPSFVVSDDCGVVKKYLPKEKIAVVDGSVSNHKLTYKEDYFLIDKLFQLRSIAASRVDNLTQLKNKVICVFGGSYGIGKEIVEIANSYDAKVYQFSRSSNGVNVKDYCSVSGALDQVFLKEGRIDSIINCAAILKKIPLNSMSVDDMKDVVEVNLLGSLNVSKASFQFLKESKGSLLLFTSSSYTLGRKMYSVYSSTKCANVNLMQALSEEWYGHNIRVNCINPERTLTPMRVSNFGLEDPKTLLSPFDVANQALNCITSEMSGQVIDVKIKSV